MTRRRIRLTSRGRGMLGGGAAAAGLGLLLDSYVLLGAGAFAMLLVSLCLGLLLLRTARTELQRASVPPTLRAGEQFSARALVRGPAWGGLGRFSGLLPDLAAATARPTVAVRLNQRERWVAAVGIGSRRGRYVWPALRLELVDPLGAVQAVLSAEDERVTLVFPWVEPLGPARVPAIPGGVSEFDDAHVLARLALGDTGGNPIPRPFRAGDSLRRMHWPATARAGEPMVRAEDNGPTRRAVVMLDTGPAAYRDEEGFERAVSAAASIAVRLLQLGWAVSVRGPAGASPAAAVWAEGRQGEAAVLTALAGVALGGGIPVGRLPDDPVDGAFAITGGGEVSPWFLPPVTTIRTEVPDRGAADGMTGVWDGSRPLADVWVAGANRLVPR